MAQEAITVVVTPWTSPTDVTLYPAGERYDSILKEEIFEWRATDVSVPMDAQINLLMTKRKLKSGMTRFSATLNFPVLEEATGADANGYVAKPKVAYVQPIQEVMYVHNRSTKAIRKDVRATMGLLTLNKGASDVSTVALSSGGLLGHFFDECSVY